MPPCRHGWSRQILVETQRFVKLIRFIPVSGQRTTPRSTKRPVAPRPHTGRRRNDAAREAILTASLRLLASREVREISIDAIAAEARVGKQTIYRWWPSKSAVLLDAMTQDARQRVPRPETGAVTDDVTAFLSATFRNARMQAVSRCLRAVAAEAERDPHAQKLLREFASDRRGELRDIFERGMARGDLPQSADLNLLVDQAFGVLWYRMLMGHAGLTSNAAAGLARALVAQARSGHA